MNELFYPKQISKFKTISCENQCFFAMPFSENYTNLYDTLTLYIENVGYKCIRVDNNLSASVPIINLILKGIATSQYVIVDISESNANVFYELGITHTVKDFENVFIIKEENSKTPFDIQHLQYIAYNKNNLKALANELVKRLNANQYKNSLKKVLLQRQLLNYDDIDEFTSYFTSLFDEKLIMIYIELLEMAETSSSVLDLSIENAIWEYDIVLKNELKKGISEKLVSVLFRIFFELLLSCYRDDEIQRYIYEFLHQDEYSTLGKESFLSYQTDLAIKFAEKARLVHISLKWIIEYFQRSKSTKVDLNRYKLEAFLLKSNSEEVNEYLVNALLSDNNYIREHMADIVGEKQLFLAEDNLITQLRREQNIYTVSSIAEAMGKLHSTKAIPSIQDWLNLNADNMIKMENYFVLKHIRNALIKLGNSNVLRQFDNKYFEILKRTNTI